MDYKQIEAFVNVVKFKSFSKAADATFLTQPTISTHIATLEKELDTVLLERGNREITLTDDGVIFYEHAMDMINSREKAYLSLKDSKTELEGVLEIYASSIPGQYILPNMCGRFIKSHPKVKLYLEQSDSDEVIDRVLSRQGEVGFVGKKVNNGLAYKLINKDKMVLIAPNNEKFRQIGNKKIRFDEFVSEPFIWREQGSATRSEFEKAILNQGITLESLNNVAKMNNLDTIKNSVSAGIGVSIVSSLAVKDNEETEKFLSFEIEDFSYEREIYMVYNEQKKLSPIVDTFIEFVNIEVEENDNDNSNK